MKALEIMQKIVDVVWNHVMQSIFTLFLFSAMGFITKYSYKSLLQETGVSGLILPLVILTFIATLFFWGMCQKEPFLRLKSPWMFFGNGVGALAMLIIIIAWMALAWTMSEGLGWYFSPEDAHYLIHGSVNISGLAMIGCAALYFFDVGVADWIRQRLEKFRVIKK